MNVPKQLAALLGQADSQESGKGSNATLQAGHRPVVGSDTASWTNPALRAAEAFLQAEKWWVGGPLRPAGYSMDWDAFQQSGRGRRGGTDWDWLQQQLADEDKDGGSGPACPAVDGKGRLTYVVRQWLLSNI